MTKVHTKTSGIFYSWYYPVTNVCDPKDMSLTLHIIFYINVSARHGEHILSFFFSIEKKPMMVM